MTGSQEDRVLVTYVCRRKQHELATVVRQGDDLVLSPVMVPVYDVGAEPGKKKTRGFKDRTAGPLVVGREPFWSTVLACGGCTGREYPITETRVAADVRAGNRRVVLDSATAWHL